MATPPLPPLTKGPPPTPEEVIKTELPKIKDNSLDTITELEGIAKILSKSSTPIAGRSSKSPIAKSRVSESRSFSSSPSSDDTEGANFAKDFVRHFSKKIGDELEDMTTFFGFNFGKHFKDGLVQTIKGKGAFGTAIKFMFKPFEGMMKASSKLFLSTDDSRLADFSEKRFKDKSLKEDELLDIQSKLETAKGEERVNLKIRENELHKEILNIKEDLKKAKLAELKLENDRLQKLEDSAKKIGDLEKERIAQYEKHKVSDKYFNLLTGDARNLEDSDLEILKFESGTKGVLGNIFADFGDGTHVILHGREAVIPENSEEGKLLKQYESSGLKQISPDSPNFEIIKPEKDSKFDILPISSMLESINFNIIKGFSSILTFFKEDSDRNEQLKDAELSRQRLLSEAKKETLDKDEIEIIVDRPEEKKSPFSFLKNIFSGIFGKMKNLLPWLTKGIAILGIVKLLKSLFMDKDWDVLSESFVESITKFTQKLTQGAGKLADFAKSLSGSPKIPSSPDALSTSRVDDGTGNLSGIAKPQSSILTEASSKGTDAFNKNFDATFKQAIQSNLGDDAARKIAKEVAEDASKEAVENFLKSLSKEALDVDNIGDVSKAAEDVTSKISKDFLKNSVSSVAPNVKTPSSMSSNLRASSVGKGVLKILDPLFGLINVGRRTDAGQSLAAASVAEGAGVLGSLKGGSLGLAKGLALGSMTGPLAPVAAPVLGVTMGLGGAMLGGTVAEAGTDFLLEKTMGPQFDPDKKFKSIESDIVDKAKNLIFGEEKLKETVKNVKEAEENNLKTSKMAKEVSKKVEKSIKNLDDSTKKIEEELKKPKTIFSRMLDTLKGSITEIPNLIKNFKSLFSEGKSVLGEGLMNTFKGLSVGFFEMFKQGDVMAGLDVMEKSVSKTALEFFETGQVKKQNAEDMVSKNVESGKNNVIKSLEQNLGNLNIVGALKQLTGTQGDSSQLAVVNSPTSQNSNQTIFNNYSNPDDSSKNKFANDYFKSLG